MTLAIRSLLATLFISGCTGLLYGPSDLALLPPKFTVPLHGGGGSFKIELLRSTPASCISFEAPMDKNARIILSKKLLEQLVVLGDTAPMERTNYRANDLLAKAARTILHEASGEHDQYGCVFDKRLDWNSPNIRYLGMALFQSGQIAVAVADFDGLVPYVTINYWSSHKGFVEIALPPEYVEKNRLFRNIVNDIWWVS